MRQHSAGTVFVEKSQIELAAIAVRQMRKQRKSIEERKVRIKHIDTRARKPGRHVLGEIAGNSLEFRRHIVSVEDAIERRLYGNLCVLVRMTRQWNPPEIRCHGARGPTQACIQRHKHCYCSKPPETS